MTNNQSSPQNKTAADAGNIAAGVVVTHPNNNPSPLKKQDKAVKRSALFTELPEPWDKPVDLADLLDEIRKLLDKHVIMKPEEKDVVALWIAFSYGVQSFRHSPRLLVTSPQMQCGKTTLLEIMSALCCKAFHTSSLSPAAVYRLIDQHSPTILADEADTYIFGNEDMRNVFNLGHTKAGSFVTRCNPNTLAPETFDAYGAMAIGQIGLPPDTVLDRCITVFMKRKKSTEKVSPFIIDDPVTKAKCEIIRQKLYRWFLDSNVKLIGADPIIPALIQNRCADKWRPLFAISELAGKAWPQKIIKAANQIITFDASENDALPIMLLHDIREIFKVPPQYQKLPTDALLKELNAIEESPWGTLSHGKPLNASRLAGMLKPFGIRSQNHTFGLLGRKKGYEQSDFTDAFERYLP